MWSWWLEFGARTIELAACRRTITRLLAMFASKRLCLCRAEGRRPRRNINGVCELAGPLHTNRNRRSRTPPANNHNFARNHKCAQPASATRQPAATPGTPPSLTPPKPFQPTNTTPPGSNSSPPANQPTTSSPAPTSPRASPAAQRASRTSTACPAARPNGPARAAAPPSPTCASSGFANSARRA